MKDEKRNFLLVSGLFTAVFILTLIISFPSIGYMAEHDTHLLIIGVLSSIVGILSWFVALNNFEDPNYDAARWVLLISFGISIAVFGAYHAQHVLDKADHITASLFL